MNRRAFQHLPASENPQFHQDGIAIYKMMKDKYPGMNAEDLDNILNGICASLTCLMFDSVEKDNHKLYLQIIHKILSDNL